MRMKNYAYVENGIARMSLSQDKWMYIDDRDLKLFDSLCVHTCRQKDLYYASITVDRRM